MTNKKKKTTFIYTEYNDDAPFSIKLMLQFESLEKARATQVRNINDIFGLSIKDVRELENPEYQEYDPNVFVLPGNPEGATNVSMMYGDSCYYFYIEAISPEDADEAAETTADENVRCSVHLDDGFSIVATPNTDSNYREVFIDLYDKRDRFVQSLAVIGEDYRYSDSSLEVIPEHGRYTIRVYAYDDRDDFTDEFTVNRRAARNHMYIIMGEAGAGKDTFAKHVKRKCELSNPYVTVHQVTFAEQLKKEARELGWNGQKDECGRTLLQNLGKVMKAYHGSDYYARMAFRGKLPVGDDGTVWIVTDARFLSEIHYARSFAEKYGIDITFIRVDRDLDPEWVSSLTEEQKKDVSEVEWKSIEPDIVIHNDGKDPEFGGQFKI